MRQGFTITPEGVISHGGVRIGTINEATVRGRFREYVVRGRWVENADGDVTLSASIAAGGAVTELRCEQHVAYEPDNCPGCGTQRKIIQCGSEPR